MDELALCYRYFLLFRTEFDLITDSLSRRSCVIRHDRFPNVGSEYTGERDTYGKYGNLGIDKVICVTFKLTRNR